MDEIRDDKFLKALGKRVRALRHATGMSDRDFANTAGIAASQVNRIDKGELDVKICTLRAIAQALDIPLSELFRGL
ncbi:XRE family transcriptional regulator [Chitinophaga lutea]|uniref:XRE family transcriptional regulator n=1 Tax=Chitinophaga lutea TaxID=2488634 RepID=A0A3N4PMN1_9BACT|nr:helix-turn-helix transcriptional regulator [Chitinophaga lutea]RPE05577.1 XRE family transcriptional regulator [Chitinophaga lutea]